MPPGGLACHLDARRFLPHLSSKDYPAGALVSALFLVSGIRAMERGSISMDRDPKGQEVPAELELARIALPRRTYTLSQMEYAIDRVKWLFRHAKLVGGLRFIEEPPVLRFFFGRLAPTSDWPSQLVASYRESVGSW
jgi:tyrosine phenol-lyase